MAYEHYHVMFKQGFANAPERLGGDIFGQLLPAAREYCYLLSKRRGADLWLTAYFARMCRERGQILRSHHHRGHPYIYLAICTLDTCDLSMIDRRTL